MSRSITCILVNEYLRPGVEGKEELTVKETKNHSYMYNIYTVFYGRKF